tara:strand:+ start:56 stop:919 length:864 start_codon:yes stop_codon:yes gene_type:complete
MEKRALAFIDILGFSNIVYSSPDKVMKIISIVKGYSRDIRSKKNDEYDDQRLLPAIFGGSGADIYAMIKTSSYKLLNDSDFQITYFSDSIVASCKPEYIESLITIVSNIVNALLEVPCLCRGGIAIDDAYHDRGDIVGIAMIRAYKIESEIANYPRVVLENSVANIILEIGKEFETKLGNYPRFEGKVRTSATNPKDKIMRDFDGSYILRPFYRSSYTGSLLYSGDKGAENAARNKWLGKWRSFILSEIEKETDEKVKLKQYWLAKKYNDFVKEFETDNDLLDIEWV